MAPNIRLNIPPVTRVLLLVQIALSLLYILARFTSATTTYYPAQHTVPYLALVPPFFLFYPWTLLTSTFVEQNIFTLLINSAVLLFGGRYLERAWGSREFIKTVLIASLIPNLLIVPIYITWAAITSNRTRAYTPITGAISLQATFLVALKQLIPEHTVTILRGILKIRVKHFPALFLLANTLSGFLLGTDTAAILAWLGLITAWIYLRFYKPQPDLSSSSIANSSTGDAQSLPSRGDASETFAFAAFFPDAIQAPIAAVCNQIYILLINMGILTPFSSEEIASGNEQAATRSEGGGLPMYVSQSQGGSGGGRAQRQREDAERRRALALRALDQRLQAAGVGGRSGGGVKNEGAAGLGLGRPQGPEPGPEPVLHQPVVVPNHDHQENALGGTDYTPDENP